MSMKRFTGSFLALVLAIGVAPFTALTVYAAENPAVSIEIDKTTVPVNGEITISWDIKEGTDPKVSGASICADVPVSGTPQIVESCSPLPISGERTGQGKTTVSLNAPKAYVKLFVNDQDHSYTEVSQPFAITGITGFAVVDVPGTSAKGQGYYDRGTVKKGWFDVNGRWFHSDSRGILQRDQWLSERGQWYYLGTDAGMVTGWALIAGTSFYFNGNGQMLTGWLNQGGRWYYLGSSGAMATGWTNIGGRWFYMNPDGAMATGWTRVGNSWYYLDGSGVMRTGWLSQGGRWYYLYSGGAMATGWTNIGGRWFYMNSNGAMATGWTQVGNSWYYLDGSGVMRTGWLSQGGRWYYLYSGGAMATGWTQVGNSWYYMYSNGVMHTGWLDLGGRWFYMKSDGVMVTGNYYVDGRTSRFDGNGVWLGYVTSNSNSNSGSGSGSGSGGSSAYYKNCTEAWLAGAAPLYRGQAGYGSHLDRDGDGKACEVRPW